MTFDLRLRELEDLPDSLSALAELARAEKFRFIDRLIAEFRTGETSFSRPGEVLLGAFDGERLIGVGGLSCDPYANLSGTGRVRRLYVHPQYRACGVGRSILERLERAAARTFTRLHLFTDTPEAAAFYEKLGYTPVESDHVSHVKGLGSSPGTLS